MNVSFGSKVRPRTFGYVAMGSAMLFILSSRLLLYIFFNVWSEQRVKLLCLDLV